MNRITRSCTIKDGRTVTHTAEQLAPGGSIVKLVLDAEGTAWIQAYDDNGIRRFDGTAWSDVVYIDVTPSPPHTLQSFAFDGNNTIWVGTDHGLFRVDGAESKRYFTSPLSDFDPVMVVVDNNNVKWFYSHYGLKKFVGETWTAYYSPKDFQWNDVRCMAVDDDNVLWLAGRFETITFDGERFEYIDALHGKSFDTIAVDHDNVKWLGGGLDCIVYRYDGSSVEQFDRVGSDLLRVDAIGVDRNNVKWFSNPASVFSYDGVAWTRYWSVDYPALYGNPFVSILATPDNMLWGGNKHGFTRFDGESWTLFPSDLTSYLTTMALDGDGAIWATCQYNLVRFDGETSKLLDISDDMRINDLDKKSRFRWVAVDRDNVKWLCGDRMAFALDTSGTNIDARAPVPAPFSLGLPRPNPFNATMSIQFTLASPGRITLDIYSVTGQTVATIADGLYNAGTHTAVWDGTDSSGLPSASGVYIARLRCGHNTASRILTLMK